MIRVALRRDLHRWVHLSPGGIQNSAIFSFMGPWRPFFFSLHFTMEAQLLFTNRMRFKTAIYRTNIPRRLQLLNCNLLGKWFYACKDFPPFGCEYLRAGKPKSRIYSSEGLDLTFLPCILDSRCKPHLQLRAEDDANAAAGRRSLRNVTRPIHF